ncbi:MAG: hypothetical protein FWE42_05765 [Defluviitaleaceae bacterium]|nr:hypothetical protein [Defluviitaleaceae bacterium]
MQEGGYKIEGRKRDIVAGLLKTSPSQVARYESINKNLTPGLTEEFKKGSINVTTAFEASRLPEKQQAEALEEHRGGKTLTPDIAKERRGKARPKISPPKEPVPHITDIDIAKQESDEIPSCPPKYCGKCMPYDCKSEAIATDANQEQKHNKCKHYGHYCRHRAHSNEISKLPSCNNCKRQRKCDYAPRPGEYARINCFHWQSVKEAGDT